ncbi:MAG: translocation/assembly module TamB domain-containing protein, partial [Prevotella sp.]|nr:translocation/assembly module TamB domain-containing protein [Prevotella sp.]
QDSTMLQDLTVSLYRLDLGEVTSVIPYLPKITGTLDGDYHIMQDQNEKISVASDMAVQDMTYEGSPIGNISTEFVYMMKEDDTHAVEARLMLDDEEFGLLSGNYQNEGEGNIDATFTMTRLPLSIANGFVPDQIIGLEGYGDGTLTIQGTSRHPDINGEVYVDSAYLVSIPYGVRMRFDNDPVRVVGSHLLLENFGLYAYNDEPLNLMGDIDFSDTDHINIDMRMQARNLLLINSKQEAKSIAYGKAFVNFFARLQGPLETMNMRGRLDVLGSTDLTYMLLDSPLSADNRLDELVKFTDFTDSTQTVITRPAPSGLKADLTISVSQGAHIVCDLNAEQTNYVDLLGGGDLRMRYNAEGINLTGRYTLTDGHMKYSLPVIPLKTFTIKDGSYVEFTGDPMNPKLNITATERTKATVNDESGVGRSVVFDCGVVITKTLNDMGLEFIIEAPEDNSVSGELTTMSKEERGKIAVTMLTTGMYLADGNTGSFSMNSALSSFLQSEINNIAGSALKTLDLSVGIDNTTDASGSMHTDYSFKFAKRFLDNRLKVEIGGKVSSGASDMSGQQQSFFDNVSMEYRLNQHGTQNVKVFYQQNVYDWLEGYTSMYGAGFVWRRKLDNFWDIFRFWKKEQQPMPMRPQQPQTPVLQSDSVVTDSIKVTADETK